MRFPRPFLLAGLCLAPAALLTAQTPETVPTTTVPAARAPEEMIDSLRLRDAPLDMIIDRLEVWTGRIVLRPQALPATAITLNIPRPVPKSDAIQAIVSVLALNNIGVVEMGDRYLKIVELANKTRTEAPEMITGSLLQLPPSGRVASKIFDLVNLKAQEFVPQLNTLLNIQLGGAVLFNNTNSFLVTDSISNLQRVEQLLIALDKPASTDFSPKFYSLQFAKASDLVSRIKLILQSPNQLALGNSLSLSADDRTNQVVLIADPKQQAFFDDLIGKLDTKADPNTRNEVMRLNNADAKEVATVLTTIITGQNTAAQKGGGAGARNPAQSNSAPAAPAAPNAPAPAATPRVASLDSSSDGTQFSNLLTVTSDTRSNAIVVSGTVDDIRLIRELIDKIDVVLPQVRIEVVIAEVTLRNNNETGISALGLRVDGNRLTGISGSTAGATLAGDGSDFASQSSGRAINGLTDLKGVISLSSNSAKTKAVVLANPTLVTTHAKEARIFVGESRPAFGEIRTDDTVGSSTGNSSALRSAVTQQQAGIELKIKPLIGSDGSVQLEISQTYNAFGAAIKLGTDLSQSAINKREASSYLTVADGEIIVLGGYRTQSQDKSRSRLGPIPIIGDLLGSRTWNKDSTELMLFIRPHVIRGLGETTADAKAKINTSTQRNEIERSLEISAPVLPELPQTPPPRNHRR